jgi:2-oxoisovalerate dehydrogenase E1 component
MGHAEPTTFQAAPDTVALQALWLTMLRIRRFDQRVRELFQDGVIKGTAHSCVGQEAIAAGACAALRDDDFIISHHRGHGHCIAKGARMDRMLAELMGRIDGYCRGLGGSMHVADLARGILGANGVVGAGIGIGTGAALAAQLRADGSAGIAFFGDGAANEGIFHEALNLAALWKLPIVYLCENNQYGLSTTMAESTAIGRLSQRAAAYSMPGFTIDGNDVLAVRAAVAQALVRARAGAGPTLIEALTWRWDEHSMRANLPVHRNAEEQRAGQAGDPLLRTQKMLLAQHAVAPGWFEAQAQAVQAEIAAAEDFARASREPTFDDLQDAVTAPHLPCAEPESWPGDSSPRTLGFAAAVGEALASAMAQDSSVLLLGEDIGKIGGIFAVTRGLQARFGALRVRDTPISEQAIALAAVGAAASGLRPVAEVQIFDFVTLMMDALVNQAAKFRFMLGGQPSVPLVLRGPTGGGVRLAAQHSQSLESWLMHVPGLVVLAPSNAYDAKGLMLSALREHNPVVFLEHKLAYLAPATPVPEADYHVPIGRAAIRRHGSHCTVVATLMMVDKALAAAAKLAREEGIECEVIDPRTLRPLDVPCIVRSVKKTSRLVVVHEGWRRAGFGAEVSAAVAEEAIDWLDAPIVRVCSKDLPMPYNDKLERATIPQEADIVQAVLALVRRDRVAGPFS